MDRNSGNLRHYKNPLEYFSFSNYKGKMKYDGLIFTEFYKPLKIISAGKMIEVGKVYFDSNGNKVFVLGVVQTSINESEHTIIVRKITDGKFNDRIDYDHDQLAAIPDWKVWSIPRSLLRKNRCSQNCFRRSLHLGMDHASIINFLSNEDTPELAPGFFITKKGGLIPRSLLRYQITKECNIYGQQKLSE
jgi:hypothetical protein